jgi:hypothetical protein
MILKLPTRFACIRKVIDRAKCKLLLFLPTNLIRDQIKIIVLYMYPFHHNFEPDIILYKLSDLWLHLHN